MGPLDEWRGCLDEECRCRVLRRLVDAKLSFSAIRKALGGVSAVRLRRWLDRCGIRLGKTPTGKVHAIDTAHGDICGSLRDMVGSGMSRNAMRRALGNLSSRRLEKLMERCGVAAPRLPYMDADAAYLLGALLGDGGMYTEKRSSGSTEYRVVWTQKQLEYLENSIRPRLERLMGKLGIRAKVQLLKVGRRYEICVGSKSLYRYFETLKGGINQLANIDWFMRFFTRGFYDAEGRKSLETMEIYNTDRSILQLIQDYLKRHDISSSLLLKEPAKPGIRNKAIYVLRVDKRHKNSFMNIVSPEHPKLNSFFFG